MTVYDITWPWPWPMRKHPAVIQHTCQFKGARLVRVHAYDQHMLFATSDRIYAQVLVPCECCCVAIQLPKEEIRGCAELECVPPRPLARQAAACSHLLDPCPVVALTHSLVPSPALSCVSLLLAGPPALLGCVQHSLVPCEPSLPPSQLLVVW